MIVLDNPDSILYLVILALLALSAFFSASESALSTVNKLRLRKRISETQDKQAKTALKLAENYDRSLFTILIGNNIANISISSISTVLATAIFGVKGAAIATGAATVLVLIFGEILPKIYATDNNEKVSLGVARPLQVIIFLLTPLTWLFTSFKKLAYKLLPQSAKGPSVTEEELIYMIGSIEKEGVLEAQESHLVRSALQFDEISIHEILTPRVHIVAIDVSSSIEEVCQTVVQEGYARIPVYEGSIDHIVGILYSREFLNAYISGKEIDLKKMLGTPLFVPKRIKLSRMLSQFKTHKVNMAVVTDDYGGTMGIVTMEDVLEELVGEIWDEDDEIPFGLVRVDDTTIEVAGDYGADDMFEALGFAPPECESSYTTVNGWALSLFEHIPKAEDRLHHEQFLLVVMEMNGQRIKRLRISISPPAAENES